MRRWGAVGLLVVLTASGCARGSKQDDRLGQSLAPQFAPDDSAGATATTAATGPDQRGQPGQPGQSTTSTPGAQGTTATSSADGTAVPERRSSFTDPVGDLTPSPADPPPPWADLAGATLIRRASGFELRIELGGGSAPSTTDEDHTMNIASFFDVNGDGGIDFEVWANLSSGGWGSSYFDNRKRGGHFQGGSGVTVTVEGPHVVVAFPLSHLEGAERFRWALASEWGRYEVLGTLAMARDDAPDNDAAARFP